MAILYQPLDPNGEEIRLCFLLPCTTDTDIIECEIYNIPIVAATSTYSALSYVWGDPEITEEIVVNDIKVRLKYECEIDEIYERRDVQIRRI